VAVPDGASPGSNVMARSSSGLSGSSRGMLRHLGPVWQADSKPLHASHDRPLDAA
jgi:hypothetical protein